MIVCPSGTNHPPPTSVWSPQQYSPCAFSGVYSWRLPCSAFANGCPNCLITLHVFCGQGLFDTASVPRQAQPGQKGRESVYENATMLKTMLRFKQRVRLFSHSFDSYSLELLCPEFAVL